MIYGYTQSPREVRSRLVNFDCYLEDGETLSEVQTTITPPKTVPATGYIPPGYDQRVCKLDMSGWVTDGIQSVFPMVSMDGGPVRAIDDQYVTLVRDSVELLNPGVDFVVSDATIVFMTPPAIGEQYWGSLQNPLVDGQSTPFSLPPYSAFDAQAYIVMPDAKKATLVTRGGSPPLTYKVLLLAMTSGGRARELRFDYAVKEP